MLSVDPQGIQQAVDSALSARSVLCGEAEKIYQTVIN